MKLRLPIATVVALAVCAPAAMAAPDHTATLSSASSKFAWEGAPQVTRGLPLYQEDVRTSIPCKTAAVRPCEDVLLEVKEPGRLTVKVDGGSGDAPEGDVDVFLYKSDSSGAAGEKISSGAAKGPDTIAAKVTPGFYLAQVDYYHAFASGYAGEASFASSAPPAAPVTPPATTPPAGEPGQPAAKKKSSKRAACQKKARKIKNKKKRKQALKRCSKAKG